MPWRARGLCSGTFTCSAHLLPTSSCCWRQSCPHDPTRASQTSARNSRACPRLVWCGGRYWLDAGLFAFLPVQLLALLLLGVFSSLTICVCVKGGNRVPPNGPTRASQNTRAWIESAASIGVPSDVEHATSIDVQSGAEGCPRTSGTIFKPTNLDFFRL